MNEFSIEGYERAYASSRDWLVDRIRDRPQRYASSGTRAFSSIALEVVDMTIVRGAEIGRQLAPLAPLVEDAIAKLGGAPRTRHCHGRSSGRSTCSVLWRRAASRWRTEAMP